MNELQQWGIMADWRYSYFSMMPKYQATTLRKFADLIRKGYIYRGSRPVFWSTSKQRNLAENEISLESEIIDSVIMKLSIVGFGKKAREIQQLYPDAKILVFHQEPWQVVDMKAVGVNENILYVLTKWNDEYLILADKRISEFQMRTGDKFKKLLTFQGDSLEGIQLANPLTNEKVPIIVNNEVTCDFGSGINAVCPAHDFMSLAVAYHYNLSKSGLVSKTGELEDDAGVLLAGLNV